MQSGNSKFKGGWKGRGRGSFAQSYALKKRQQDQQMQQNGGASQNFSVHHGPGGGIGARQVEKNVNVNSLKAANPLNQYYIEQFIKLKKDADFKNLRNQSFCYKRVLLALAKYPIPILCGQQCQFLEGVGDTVAHKFVQMIQDREKEYEDGLFFGGIAQDQRRMKQKKLKTKLEKFSKHQDFDEEEHDLDYKFDVYQMANCDQASDPDHILKNFAGISLNSGVATKPVGPGEEKPDVMNMSLKQYLIAQDKINFQNNFGQLDAQLDKSKKRGRPGQNPGQHKTESDQEGGQSDEEMDIDNGQKRLKNGESDFLEVGSTSWSMLMALYFLSLHDDSKDACMTFDSIQEILDVLKQEFGDMVPLVNNIEQLIREGPYELQKFREHCFIELIDLTARDPFQWRMLMTQKGVKRAKGLCKSVGILVNLEVDLNDKSRNKITINMYDRHLMPLVEDLYFTDQAQTVRAMKQDANVVKEDGIGAVDAQGQGSGIEPSYLERQTAYFSRYICQIEDEIMESMGANNFVQGGEDEEHLRESGEMIGNANKKLVQPKAEPAPGAVDLNLDNEGPGKNDISIMADIFEEANRDCEEDAEDNEIQIVDVTNAYDRGGKSQNVKIKHISENLKLEIKPKDKKNKTGNQQFSGGVFDSDEAEIVLIVDNREKRNNQDINYFYDRFKASGIKTELKSLPLGDFIWILRIKNNQEIFYEEPDQNELAEINNPDPDQQDENNGIKKKTKPKKTKKAKKKLNKISEFTDYVLDFIVERKTADDLAASIMDGRYEEQKFRLKNCGINNVIYLVEGTPGQYCKIPEAVLRKASIHTQIFHGFNVMRIPTIQESLKWLTQMTKEMAYRMNMTQKQMAAEFEHRIKDTLIDFKQFQNESSKNSNLNVQQIFARQLRTIKGLGIDNCSAITRVFKTPRLLQICFEKCDQSDVQKENLLNAGKLELMKNQYAYKDSVNNCHNAGEFALQDFIPADEMGNPDLPKSVDDVDKINLINVISSAIPKFYGHLHKEFAEATGVTVRKINQTQCKNMRKLFCQRGRYVN